MKIEAEKERILVLAGHLDDSVLSIGGIIKKLTASNHHVAVVCFGNGDEGFAHVRDRESCVDKFKNEAIAAHEILGVKDFVCHDYPDFGVQENKDTYRKCIEAIRRVRPGIIFGHYWREYFQHRSMARLTCDSWYQAGWECSADLGPAWQARSMYHYEVLQTLPDPTHLVDVSDTFEFKLAAWRCFQTGQEHLGGMADQMEARARYYGSLIGVKYAEALIASYFLPKRIDNPSVEL